MLQNVLRKAIFTSTLSAIFHHFAYILVTFFFLPADVVSQFVERSSEIRDSRRARAAAPALVMHALATPAEGRGLLRYKINEQIALPAERERFG